MIRIFLLFFGIIITSYGLSFNILYLNLLNNGYNLFNYFSFIMKRFEFIIFIFGLILIILAIDGKKIMYKINKILHYNNKRRN